MSFERLVLVNAVLITYTRSFPQSRFFGNFMALGAQWRHDSERGSRQR
jgi:hypothetical protein